MSGSVFLNNLDDFIAPSQACVNPLVASKLEANAAATSGRITLQNDFSKSEFDDIIPKKPDLIKTKVTSSNTKVASVSLNDCLACSGCVTSAETVLIQEQSFDKLLNKLNEVNTVDIVVMISPNSRASLAETLGMTSIEVFLRIASVLKSLGIKYVIDASCGGDIALIESREEFLSRYKKGRSNTWSIPQYTTANSSTSFNLYENKSNNKSTLANASTATPSIRMDNQVLTSTNIGMLPVFTSNCPGWVCYAEKTTPQAIPYLSSVKSPQQIIGTLIKHIHKSNTTETKKSIFVVSIQPCFDKKLEASRRDFYHSDSDEVEVDLVLSTAELWGLLESKALESLGLDSENSVTASQVSHYLTTIPLDNPHGCDEMERLFRCFSEDGQALVSSIDSNGSSGGYTEYVFKYAAQELFGINLWNTKLEYKEGRNPDMAEIDICSYLPKESLSNENLPKLKFARAYGFRNIKGITLKMQSKRCEYDLVEVMACPSGCNNGGGQMKAGTGVSSAINEDTTLVGGKERLKRIDAIFHSNNSTIVRSPDNNLLAHFVYSSKLVSTPLSSTAMSLLHTRYHAVPSLEIIAPLAMKW